MKSLQLQYSTEIARELGKIAVYLPGEKVTVGDIIRFPFGKRGFLQKVAPLGSFQKITDLNNLGIQNIPMQQSDTPDSYRFCSKQAVDFQLTSATDMRFDYEALPSANTELEIRLSATGAIYFCAINCYKTSLNNIAMLENEINSRGKRMVWDDTFLVTAVTVAQKALIIQSKSNQSAITLGGNVQGLQSNQLMHLGTKHQIHIKKQQGDLFIKDWSDQVTVFMELMKFEKETFDSTYKETPKQLAFPTTTLNKHQYRLTPVIVSDSMLHNTYNSVNDTNH